MRTEVVALIPAHNEEKCIGATVESLLTQSQPPDRIIVIADNCTDATGQIARGMGVEVWPTRYNKFKKAGALNQVLNTLMPRLNSMILTMDADTVLSPTWIEDSVEILSKNPGMGAISGTYQARPHKGLIALLQRVEYHQVHRRISRKGGHVYVLSGTATLTSPHMLRELYRTDGFIYDKNSLVEDFDYTLRARFLGYEPRTFKHLLTTTDVMETWGDLTRQRLRWQRGTLETLIKYGWQKYTRKLWLGQLMSYSMTFVFAAVIFAWGYTIHMGVAPQWIWLSIIPIFMLAQYAETKGTGWKETLLAVLLIPLWFYDLYRIGIYWFAASRVIRKTHPEWN